MTAQDRVRILKDTIRWLDALEGEIGQARLLDCMPNNYAGRFDLWEMVQEMEQDLARQPQENQR